MVGNIDVQPCDVGALLDFREFRNATGRSNIGTAFDTVFEEVAIYFIHRWIGTAIGVLPNDSIILNNNVGITPRPKRNTHVVTGGGMAFPSFRISSILVPEFFPAMCAADRLVQKEAAFSGVTCIRGISAHSRRPATVCLMSACFPFIPYNFRTQTPKSEPWQQENQQSTRNH